MRLSRLSSACVTSVSLVVSLLVVAPTAAQAETAFPYQTQVLVDGAECRADSKSDATVTSRLAAGTPVTVVRHDPGGWCMIKPPPGSFSYIRPQYVRDFGNGDGVVEVEQVGSAPATAVVRIGSSVSDDAFTSGRLLRSGHRVTILGRAIVNTGGGRRQEMLRIAPPPREFRWIRGDLLASPTGDSLMASDPQATTPVTLSPGRGPAIVTDGVSEPPIAFGSGESSERLDQQVESTVSSGAARRTGTNTKAARAEQATLSGIDERFRVMVQTDPGTWDLDGLERDYRRLHEATASESMRAMVAKRLAALQRRREVYRQYIDFITLTSKTSEREQALLAEQSASAGRLQELQAPIDLGSSIGLDPSGATTPGPATAVVDTQPPRTARGTGTPPSTYVGAGMIAAQRSPLGLTRYLLVSPSGKTLAIVRPARGVEMTSHIGQSRGLVGQRTFDPSAGIDVIDATRLDPVNLTPEQNPR